MAWCGRLESKRSGLQVADGSVGAFVHGEIRQAVGVLVLTSEYVIDAEGLQFCDMAFGLVVERAQVGAFDAVLALHLLDHELGVSDDAQLGVAPGEGEFEGGQQAGVFSEVVGLNAEEFVQLFDLVAVGVFNADAVTGRAGITA